MRPAYTLDATRWLQGRSPAYRAALLGGLREGVEIVAEIVHSKTLANVSGAKVGAGRLTKGGAFVRRTGRGVTATRGRATRQLVQGGAVSSLIKRQLGSASASLPVPRVTGNLARSIKNRPIPGSAGLTRVVYADPRQAHYARYVHDGTKKMPGRPFLGIVVRDNRRAMQHLMGKIVKDRLNGVTRGFLPTAGGG